MNPFDQQLSADRNAFRFNGTDIEPENVTVSWGEIKHLIRSGEDTKCPTAFNYLARIEADGRWIPSTLKRLYWYTVREILVDRQTGSQ